MIYADFEALAFASAGALLWYCLLSFLFLFLLTRKVSGGFFVDPFHFYYAFTYGTSYGVVLLLAQEGYLQPEALWIVFGFGAFFLAAYRYLAFERLFDLNPLVQALCLPAKVQGRTVAIMLAIYITLAAANVWVAGFGFLAESRFESAIGFGPIIRVIEPLRLLLVAWFGLKLIRRWRAGLSYVPGFALLLSFALFSALLNGAKFAFLEAFYAVAVAAIVAKVKLRIKPRTLYISLALLVAVILVFALLVMSYNITATGGDPFADSESIPGAPVLLERFIGRIIWNGDMYFLSLPDEIYRRIAIDNALIRFATSVLGSQIVSPLVGYDATQFEVGRLIWLYWAPDDEVMRGPTNHFDLTAYFYFGPLLGLFFVLALAALLSQINRLVFGKTVSDDYRAMVVSVLWCKSLAMLLHPAAGFAWCLDLLAVLFFCKLISLVCFGRAPCTAPL